MNEQEQTFTLPVSEVLAMLAADRVAREPDAEFYKRLGMSPPKRGKGAP